jgi:hypothetical protein
MISRARRVAYGVLSYDIGKGKIIWAARSETMNPSSTGEVVTGIIDASAEQMRKDGLLAAPAS